MSASASVVKCAISSSRDSERRGHRGRAWMLETPRGRHDASAQALGNGGHDVETVVAHRPRRSHRDMNVSGAKAGKSRVRVHPRMTGHPCHPAVPRDPACGKRRQRLRATEEPRSRREPTKQPESRCDPCRRIPAPRRLVSQRQQHPRDVDPDRADFAARSAQAAGLRQVGHAPRPRALALHRADRPGIDAAVRVAADLLVDRTGVQARAAADAVQHLREFRARAAGCGRCPRARCELLGPSTRRASASSAARADR